MKRTAIIIIGIFLAYGTANAQLRFGIRAGMNNATKIGGYSNDDVDLSYDKGKWGFHFGVTSQIEFFNVFIQPELLFSTNTNDVILKDVVNGDTEIGEQTFNKLDIPVLAGIKLAAFKIEAGPVLTTMLSSKSDLLKENGISSNFKKATMGYQIGAGLELGGLSLEARYEGNLSKFGTGVTVGGEKIDFDSRMNQILFSIGLYF